MLSIDKLLQLLPPFAMTRTQLLLEKAAEASRSPKMTAEQLKAQLDSNTCAKVGQYMFYVLAAFEDGFPFALLTPNVEVLADRVTLIRVSAAHWFD